MISLLRDRQLSADKRLCGHCWLFCKMTETGANEEEAKRDCSLPISCFFDVTLFPFDTRIFYAIFS